MNSSSASCWSFAATLGICGWGAPACAVGCLAGAAEMAHSVVRQGAFGRMVWSLLAVCFRRPTVVWFSLEINIASYKRCGWINSWKCWVLPTLSDLWKPSNGSQECDWLHQRRELTKMVFRAKLKRTRSRNAPKHKSVWMCTKRHLRLCSSSFLLNPSGFQSGDFKRDLPCF